jgi:hypothetical protein
MNTHNWVNILRHSLQEAAPMIFTSDWQTPSPTALAPARHRGSILGLESALYVLGLIQQEPLPVRLVIPRGLKPSRFKDPPIEYHWSSTPDPRARELWFQGIRVCVHSLERAVIDILRAREPNLWPVLWREDVSEAAIMLLAAPLRATTLVTAWIERLQPKPPPAPPPEPRREAGDEEWW